MDVVVSNCVINLSPNKRRVFEEVFRVLKTGRQITTRRPSVYYTYVYHTDRPSTYIHILGILYGERYSGANGR